MAHQLAHSRSRHSMPQMQARVRVGAATSDTNWKSVTAMLAGGAIGGLLMYEGHVITGTVAMGAGLLIGTYLEQEKA